MGAVTGFGSGPDLFGKVITGAGAGAGAGAAGAGAGACPGPKQRARTTLGIFSGWVRAGPVYNLEHRASKSEHNRKRPGQETMQSCKSIQVHIN
jgi:hypothetical protein